MTSEPPARGFGGWIAGRCGRKEYWLWIAPLMLLGFVLGAVALPGAGLIVGLPTLFAMIRRLHDLGRTGWWAPGINVLSTILGFALGAVLLGPDIGLAVASVLQLGAIAALGAVPGQPHANEFGPPPGRTDLKATFS